MTRKIDVEALCHEKGLRITEQRRVIAKVLSEAEDHPDVEALHTRASAIDSGISIATVYRTVRLFEDTEPNIAIFAIACVALLFAEEGKPIAIQDEDEFFAIVGALILPRLKAISTLISNRDVAGLSRELAEIKAMY